MTMTLEQVRDWHIEQGHKLLIKEAGPHYEMADAITAHLSAQAKVRVKAPHSVEEVTQMLAAIEKQDKEVVLGSGASVSGMLLAYAARLSQDSSWQAIVQHCMVTEAVTPREDDPYGTINDIISWHVNADRLSQGAQGEAKCHRCGATSEDQAETMCIPDGDSCPGCERPLSDQWKDERAAVPEDVVHAMDRACDVMAEAYAVYQLRLGPFASQLQKANTLLRRAKEKLTNSPQPPEGARVVPDDLEEVIVSLGDDAAYLRLQKDNGECEIADNMERAAEIIEQLAAPTLAGKEGA